MVYGDLSVSSLYVFRATFSDLQRADDLELYEVYGVVSFIFWTLTLIPVIKYSFLVLNADDNGEGATSFIFPFANQKTLPVGFMVLIATVFDIAGGTFALYALLCRHLKLSLILNQQAADEKLSLYKLEHEQTAESPRGVYFRRLLEKHKSLQTGLLIVVLLGTCMVIGDGALTPALSGKRSFLILAFFSVLKGYRFVSVLEACLLLV